MHQLVLHGQCVPSPRANGGTEHLERPEGDNESIRIKSNFRTDNHIADD